MLCVWVILQIANLNKETDVRSDHFADNKINFFLLSFEKSQKCFDNTAMF